MTSNAEIKHEQEQRKEERIKREYFIYLKEAKRHSEPTVDAAAKAINRFETYTKHRDFQLFQVEQAVAFKRFLSDQKNIRSGGALSKGTLYATLTQLKRFFEWLAMQPGYKSRLKYTDAEYFNLSDKDTRIATARREQKGPTLEQIKHVLNTMPSGTVLERRNRALIAFTALTGARDSAIASMKLKHVDLTEGCVHQDARDVRTKFSKTFVTYYFPVGDEIRGIVEDWILFLKTEELWGMDDPLFPATRMTLSAAHEFQASGLEHARWTTASPIRRIFRDAFHHAGLQSFNPHSFRNTLVRLGQELCRNAEAFKAWSQNLGHEQVLTTFMSYGSVARDRQGAILRTLGSPVAATSANFREIADAVIRGLRDAGASV